MVLCRNICDFPIQKGLLILPNWSLQKYLALTNCFVSSIQQAFMIMKSASILENSAPLSWSMASRRKTLFNHGGCVPAYTDGSFAAGIEDWRAAAVITQGSARNPTVIKMTRIWQPWPWYLLWSGSPNIFVCQPPPTPSHEGDIHSSRGETTSNSAMRDRWSHLTKLRSGHCDLLAAYHLRIDETKSEDCPLACTAKITQTLRDWFEYPGTAVNRQQNLRTMCLELL